MGADREHPAPEHPTLEPAQQDPAPPPPDRGAPEEERRDANGTPSVAEESADAVIHVAAPPETPDPHSSPRSLFCSKAGETRQGLSPEEVAEILSEGNGTLWVDIDAFQPLQHAWLSDVFNFHPLAVEDTLSPMSRVKLEEYPGYLFVIIRGIRFDDDTADPYDLETFNLCFFIGQNYVVTTRGACTDASDSVWERLVTNPDLLSRGAARVAHTVMDQAVDDYFPVLARVDDFIDELEERVFVRAEQNVLRDIFSVKRLVLALRRHLQPQREVLNALTNRPTPLLPPDTQLYFRDVYDHVLRITDSLDSYRELLSSTLDSSLTQTSNRLATVTKTLSVLATLSIPFVMVSGMWGMNFSHIPLEDNSLGFWLMLLLQLLLGLIVVVGLKWKRLL